MKEEEFRVALTKRRLELRVTYLELQDRTELGYNTVRRVFSNPMRCRIGSVIRIVQAMGCYLDFTVEDTIGDGIEPDINIEPVKKKEIDEF